MSTFEYDIHLLHTIEFTGLSEIVVVVIGEQQIYQYIATQRQFRFIFSTCLVLSGCTYELVWTTWKSFVPINQSNRFLLEVHLVVADFLSLYFYLFIIHNPHPHFRSPNTRFTYLFSLIRRPSIIYLIGSLFSSILLGFNVTPRASKWIDFQSRTSLVEYFERRLYIYTLSRKYLLDSYSRYSFFRELRTHYVSIT